MARAASASCRRLRRCLRATRLDRPQNLLRRLLDRELRDVDHGTAETPLHRSGFLELLVDFRQLGVPSVVRTEVAHTGAADVGKAVGVDREADDLRGIELE